MRSVEGSLILSSWPRENPTTAPTGLLRLTWAGTDSTSNSPKKLIHFSSSFLLTLTVSPSTRRFRVCCFHRLHHLFATYTPISPARSYLFSPPSRHSSVQRFEEETPFRHHRPLSLLVTTSSRRKPGISSFRHPQTPSPDQQSQQVKTLATRLARTPQPQPLRTQQPLHSQI